MEQVVPWARSVKPLLPLDPEATLRSGARLLFLAGIFRLRKAALALHCHASFGPHRQTLAWISHCRRLARDFERHVRTVVAFVYLAMIRLMIRRLAATRS